MHLLLTIDYGRTSSSRRGCYFSTRRGMVAPEGFNPSSLSQGGKPCPSMCLAKHRSANMEGKKKILVPSCQHPNLEILDEQFDIT